MRKMRILVSQQGCIPIYRKSFFRRLNALGSIDYVIAHGQAPQGTDLILAQPPFDFPNLPLKNYEITICGISCIWQPIVWKIIRGDYDGAVFGDEVKFLSNFFATLVLRLRGRPVLLWGFGFHQYKGPNTLGARITTSLARLYKNIFYHLVSGYLAYTEGGKQALRRIPAAPQRIVVLRNTIDTELEGEFRAAVASESVDIAIRQLGVRPNTAKLLYFGRLLPNKHVDLLIEYAMRCTKLGRGVDVIIFGQGAEEKRLHALARNLSNVVFHHHDDLLLARALRISLAVVIPGFVGLAINHSFAHGVPVLTRRGQSHSPEVEYLKDGVNGRMLPQVPEEFFAALDAFIDDHNEQRSLAEGAERTAHELDMSHMAAKFHGIVKECLESSDVTAGRINVKPESHR